MGGMGPGSGMMARHHAVIPADYAGLTNPIAPTTESLARGESIYTAQCAVCHGDGGMGDGPAGQALDPAPAPVAHTSQMLGDDYLFWRISEGGSTTPFNSAMPSFKNVLSKQERWDVINYVRALGRGQMMPRRGMGGQAYNADIELKQRAEMLSQAVEQDVLSPTEADIFNAVHQAMDELMAANETPDQGGPAQMQQQMLGILVERGKITQTQADAFSRIHDELVQAGLMQ